MCRDWTDHEIHADEIEDVREAMEDRPAFEPTDEELEEMNVAWQGAMAGCMVPWNPPQLPSIDAIIENNRLQEIRNTFCFNALCEGCDKVHAMPL